eukprot:11088746-Heterocapsa_arctica.AAC.1
MGTQRQWRDLVKFGSKKSPEPTGRGRKTKEEERGPDKWIIEGQEYDLRTTSPKLIEQMAIAKATAGV